MFVGVARELIVAAETTAAHATATQRLLDSMTGKGRCFWIRWVGSRGKGGMGTRIRSPTLRRTVKPGGRPTGWLRKVMKLLRGRKAPDRRKQHLGSCLVSTYSHLRNKAARAQAREGTRREDSAHRQ